MVVYRGYIGVYIGIMKKKMETAIWGLGFKRTLGLPVT